MTGRHAHSRHGTAPTPPKVLAGVVVLLCAVALAMVWLWPDGSVTVLGGQDGQQVNGVIDGLERLPCAQPSEAPPSETRDHQQQMRSAVPPRCA